MNGTGPGMLALLLHHLTHESDGGFDGQKKMVYFVIQLYTLLYDNM